MTIRPRTGSERAAYLAGYVAAIANVAQLGLDRAREEGRVLIVAEDAIAAHPRKHDDAANVAYIAERFHGAWITHDDDWPRWLADLSAAIEDYA